jgi:hypothetical protein
MNVSTVLSKDIYSMIKIKNNITTSIAEVMRDIFNEEKSVLTEIMYRKILLNYIITNLIYCLSLHTDGMQVPQFFPIIS